MHAALLLAALCAAAPQDDAVVTAIRGEHRAVARVQALLSWFAGTRGAAPTSTLYDQERLVSTSSLQAVARARAAAAGDEALALGFLQRALLRERLSLPLAALDAELARTEASATVQLPWRRDAVAFRDADGLLAREPDPSRRQAIFAAINAVRAAALNPLLARREEAAQRSAREAGFADYVAFAEDQREVDLHALLRDGVRYVQATEPLFRATLDRVAREELGLSRTQLRRADLPRLWKAPLLARYFDAGLELGALGAFLDGLGLRLGSVRIDDAPLPRKRPRAFVVPVAPGDVRLSVKPSGGLDDYGSLFHEAGHAVHFASASVQQEELIAEGHAAPGEAYGELFREAFADAGWLLRYREFLRARERPVPTDAELGAVLRRTALNQMWLLRRHAFARVAYELRLHGRPVDEIAPALALLPDPARAQESLPELYRQLFSVASGIALDEADAQLFRTDVDDAFLCADYARALVLAGMLHDALRARFGPDWPGRPEAGTFLRTQLFAAGTSLSAEEVARRVGSTGLDFSGAAAHAARLISDADALSQAK